MLKAKLILERLDKDYRLLERREQPSRSFVKNFISLLYCAHAQILAAAPYGINDISNSARNIDSEAGFGVDRGTKSNLKVGASGGLTSVICLSGYPLTSSDFMAIEAEKLGIQVGTGVVAVTPTDVALAIRIAHGRAATQLEYGGCELLNLVFANPNGEFTIRRYFTNNSGAPITVNEAGIFAAATRYEVTAATRWAWAFLIARDLVAPGVAVANGELLRAQYVVGITV